MEEDIVGLQRVVAGQDLAVCDFCGQSGGELAIERIDGARNAAEPVDFVYICRDCRGRLERGEIELDAELVPGLDPADD